MTHELTHEQAAVLRYFAIRYLSRSDFDNCLFVLRAKNYLQRTGDGGDIINMRGLNTLVDYDRDFSTVRNEELAKLRKSYAALNQVHMWASPDAAVRMYLPKQTLKWLDEVRRKIEMELS